MTKEEKGKLLDKLGEIVIRGAYDPALKISMDIARMITVNPIKRQQYKGLSNLTGIQQEAVCELLAETASDVIYLFLEMFEENREYIKLLLNCDGMNYDVVDISEKVGSEIARFDEEGWIQKFSEIG